MSFGKNRDVTENADWYAGYTGKTVTDEIPREFIRRREKADEVVNIALATLADDPARISEVVKFFEPSSERRPPAPWRDRTRRCGSWKTPRFRHPFLAVRRGADRMGLTEISTGFSSYPVARLDFDPPARPQISRHSSPSAQIRSSTTVSSRVVTEAHSRVTRGRLTPSRRRKGRETEGPVYTWGPVSWRARRRPNASRERVHAHREQSVGTCA